MVICPIEYIMVKNGTGEIIQACINDYYLLLFFFWGGGVGEREDKRVDQHNKIHKPNLKDNQ